MQFRLFVVFLAFQRLCLAVRPARTVVVVHPANEDEFFLRSVFRALRVNSGQFSSRIQISLFDLSHYGGRKFEHKTTVVIGQEERYSFRSGCGAYEMRGYRNLNPFIHLYTSGKEIHSLKDDTCVSRPFTRTELSHHLSSWLPLQVLQEPNGDYDFLGEHVTQDRLLHFLSIRSSKAFNS